VSAIFLAVMAAFGTVRSPWAVLALAAAGLTGVAVAAPIVAFAATQEIAYLLGLALGGIAVARVTYRRRLAV
jgi:hypothetical protein